MTTQANVPVVYNFGTHEQGGSLDAATVVYLVSDATPAPCAWWPVGITGEMLASEWAEYAPVADPPRGAYIRHGNRAIPVRLAGGAS